MCLRLAMVADELCPWLRIVKVKGSWNEPVCFWYFVGRLQRRGAGAWTRHNGRDAGRWLSRSWRICPAGDLRCSFERGTGRYHREGVQLRTVHQIHMLPVEAALRRMYVIFPWLRFCIIICHHYSLLTCLITLCVWHVSCWQTSTGTDWFECHFPFNTLTYESIHSSSQSNRVAKWDTEIKNNKSGRNKNIHRMWNV